MKKSIYSLPLGIVISLILINYSCTKLDTTSIGSDLIPEVDNVNTFADTFSIETTQGAFEGSVYGDTTRLRLADNYAVGKMNDPLFGGTQARLFLQLKPGFYPYFIGIPGDTIKAFDSVVLCLSYKGIYGDTTIPIKLLVNEILPSPQGEWDSLRTLRTINYEPNIGNALSEETSIDLNQVRRFRRIGKGKDSVINQIRIRLSDDFRNALFSQDTTLLSDQGFSRDSLFRAFNNGFAVTMTQGNSLIYTRLTDASTRLELHYKRKNRAPAPLDTSMSVFTFNDGTAPGAPSRGAAANKIVRTRNPLPSGAEDIYIQTTPGTFANIKIPQLTGYTNRIIHRAEIIMEEVPGDPVNNGYFRAPSYLYIDLVDSGTTRKWKPIYFDLSPSVTYDPDHKLGGTIFDYYPFTYDIDFNYFGGLPKKRADGRVYYTINVSRYLQQLVTKGTPNYEMRLFAPHSIIYPQYAPTVIPYLNNVADGRIRLAGGAYPDPNLRMKMRIIYSKIN